MTDLVLTRPLERALRAGHPWIYREALDGPRAPAGEVVTVLDREGRFVARGLAESGPIAVRVLTTLDEPVDVALLGRRLRRAAELRDRVVDREATDCYRLVHGEGDRLPGLVVDVYADVAVVKPDGEAMAAWLERLLPALTDRLGSRGVRTLCSRTGRGASKQTDVLWGPPPPEPVRVLEHGMRLRASVTHGQKTGLFLDHRESRRRARGLAAGMRVLNLYGYTGGFSIAAALGGALEVTTVDVAPAAIELARVGFEDNGLDARRHLAEVADVPRFLSDEAPRRPRYDLVVSDPPSFAPREAAVPAALEAYRELHRACVERLAPGGLLLAASCSSHVGRDAFEDTLRAGSRDAGRTLQVLDRWGAPPDHPRLLGFPEGDYLCVTLLRAP